MTRVYLADAQHEERSALRLVLTDLKMEVVGEAADWATTLAQAPSTRMDMMLVDWDLLPKSPREALSKLRNACPAASPRAKYWAASPSSSGRSAQASVPG